MDSTINHKQGSQRIVRHPEYYIHGGDIIFRVEDTLFRVHRYFFTRESAFFRTKLPHPPPPGEFTKGSSDNQPLFLEDTLQVDFERFLWVFYNPKYSLYHATVEEWTSIVKLAHQWDFSGVKALVVRELERLEIPPLQKIVIYHSYVIDRRLLRSAYAAFASRDEPITIEEGQKLGLETSLQLAHARELARVPATAGKRSKDARSPAKVTGAELDELIRELFQLPPLERDPAGHVGRPTGNGNITSGQAEPQSSTQPNRANSNDLNSVKGRQHEHRTPISLCDNF
ncbi:hypothetical protein BJV74DRAFT_785522 [Russula compacta]|nr:hypothetical protein BJV74DRAFT_785522 [Russula compacta]